MRSTYSAVIFNGPITASSVLLIPCMTILKSPLCLDVSILASSFPLIAASTCSLISPVMALIESIQRFTLFFILLKSPLYSSVILSGIFPFDMRSIYSAITFSGDITASRILFRPLGISLKSIPVLSGSPRESSLPFTILSVISLKSSTIPVIFPDIDLLSRYAIKAPEIIEIIPTSIVIFLTVVIGPAKSSS